MNVLIVLAHPEANSFSRAMVEVATANLKSQGHDVLISDLYAMKWDPVSGRSNFESVFNDEYYKQQDEEMFAASHRCFAPELKEEMDKLAWCDAIILQFPMWWFGMPAILKGWIDRVFAMGFACGSGKVYENGVFRGKRAMLALTTGAPAESFAPGGRNGELDAILFPIQHGMLWFTGMDVVPAFSVHGPARMSPEQRAGELERYRKAISQFFDTETIRYDLRERIPLASPVWS